MGKLIELLRPFRAHCKYGTGAIEGFTLGGHLSLEPFFAAAWVPGGRERIGVNGVSACYWELAAVGSSRVDLDGASCDHLKTKLGDRYFSDGFGDLLLHYPLEKSGHGNSVVCIAQTSCYLGDGYQC